MSVTYQDKPWLKYYDEGVAEHLQYPEFDLSGMLSESARKYADRPACSFQGKRMNYAKLDGLASKFAAWLYDQGLRKGDKVALHLPNCPQFAIAYFGALRAGCIVVAINPTYKGRDLSFILTDSGATTVVTLSKFFGTVDEIRDVARIERLIVTNIKEYFPTHLKVLFTLLKEEKEGHRLSAEAAGRFIPFQETLQAGNERFRGPTMSQEDTAVLQYTGGTTGVPKGAVLTHRNLISNVVQVQSWLNADFVPGEEVFLAVLPFFHIYGMTANLNYAFHCGAMVVMHPQFEVRKTLEDIEKMKVTLFPGVPSIYVVLLNNKKLKDYDLSSIKYCISGAAPLPVEVQKRFEEVTGATMIEAYGLSETSPLTHANPLRSIRVPGKIGLPVPDTEAKVVNLETGEDLPVGEIGELAVRGPQVMKEYWNAPTETRAVMRAGWFHTGDIAMMDEKGFFQIVDRAKDMIIMGGFNVYPREIEEVLFEHPKVKEAAVIGKSHALRGESIKAFIVIKEGETMKKSEIISYCRETLPKYKCPREIEFVDEVPKSLIGKPLRRVLREQEAERGNAELVEDEE